MSTSNDPHATEPAGLQFEHAETETPPSATTCCVECGTELMSSYFQINGRIVCEGCRYKIESVFKGGSGLGRFVRSTVLGLLAGAAGAGLYFGVTALTGYELSIVAIVVGLLVGGAVRIGSNRRGGWFYQSLAMFLTYSAIVSTYIPPIYKAFREEAEKQAGAESTSGNASPREPDSSSSPTSSVSELPRPVRYAIGFTVLFAIAFVAPFLAGLENIIGLLIIAIGLYEAWKMNKRAVLEITGPHRLGSAAQPAGGVAADAGA